MPFVRVVEQLSIDEAVIPWRRRLRMRTYNPGKLTKHGLFVRVVTESTSGYIGNVFYKKLLFQFWNPVLIKITMFIKPVIITV
jgi:hypothetical protein